MFSLRRVVSQLEIVQQCLNPRRIKVNLTVPAGRSVPLWYGRAYLLVDREAGVYYPIPLHWVVRWAREIFFRFKFSRLAAHERLLGVAYVRGFEQGRSLGYANARRDVEALMKDILAGWERDLIERGTTPLIVQPTVERIEVNSGQPRDKVAGPGSAAEGTPSA